MGLDGSLHWLYATGIAAEIRENDNLFPWIESVHVLAITLVVGSIAIVDLRLLGLASLDRPVPRLAEEVLRCTWIAFAVAAVSGGLLFASNAVSYAHNFYFLAKLVFLLLAGLNMALFHLFIGRDIHRWGTHPHPIPLRAKLAGMGSLAFWIGVVACGRWVGFTLKPAISG